MDCKKIGEYIQLKRKAIGLTQQDLGDKLGVTSKAVSKWECGVALPDVSLFKDISSALNIEIEELLNGEDNKKIPVDKKKNIIVICLSILVVLLLIPSIYFGVYFYNNYNKVYVYDLESSSTEFEVDGNLFVIGDKKYLAINNIKYNLDKDISFSNVEYEIHYLGSTIYQRNDLNVISNNSLSFEKYLNDLMFFVEINDDDGIQTNDSLVVNIRFVDENEELRNYEINLIMK